MRKEKIGFLFVYENNPKKPGFSKEDWKIFEEENYTIILIIIRGNFPNLSKM